MQCTISCYLLQWSVDLGILHLKSCKEPHAWMFMCLHRHIICLSFFRSHVFWSLTDTVGLTGSGWACQLVSSQHPLVPAAPTLRSQCEPPQPIIYNGLGLTHRCSYLCSKHWTKWALTLESLKNKILWIIYLITHVLDVKYAS